MADLKNTKMEVFEVTYETFGNIICNPFHIYGNANYNHLKKHNCDSIHYLLFREGKYRLGIIGGIKGGAFLSLPTDSFGGFIYLQDNIKISYIDNAIDLLVKWAKSKKLKAINLTLPPSIYNESFISKQMNSLFNNSFFILKIELNHILPSAKFNDNYINEIGKYDRNNLNKALKNNLTFHQCENLLEKRIAYQIISLYKQTQNEPLKISWKEILMTTTIIDTEFFITYDNNNFPVAAAIVFHLSPSIVQIFNWGENPEFLHLRTMNYLAYKIFEYYHRDYQIIDLGPSSENAVPNIDLCNFNESIGCDTTLKFSFIRSLT